MITNESKTLQIKNSLSAWPKALKYIIQNKWIQKYIILAVFLNFIVFLILVAFSGWFSTVATSFIQNYFDLDLDGLLFVLVNIIFWVILIFFIIQTFSSITSIVNAPVYNLLTTKIIEREFPGVNFAKSNFVSDILNALVFELKKIILALVIIFAGFFINIIPIIGSILYLVLIFLQLIFMTGLDTFEPFHSLKKFSFRKRLEQISAKPCKYWPFLLISGILGSIPFLNIFLIPVSIVGASKLMKKDYNL